jgi:hypothetical protein
VLGNRTKVRPLWRRRESLSRPGLVERAGAAKRLERARGPPVNFLACDGLAQVRHWLNPETQCTMQHIKNEVKAQQILSCAEEEIKPF